MKRFIIEDFSEVAEAMYDEIVNKEKEEVLFVGFYDDAVDVIKKLMMYGEVIPYSLEIEPEEFDGYSKEYYVTLDNDMNLWCQPAYHEEKEFYFATDTDVAFIVDNAQSGVLKTTYANEKIEVTFEEDEDKPYCGECCGECCCDDKANMVNTPNDRSTTTKIVKDENGRVRGFEKSWMNHKDGMYYYSKYEHYSDDQELLHRLMKDFDVNIK